MAKAWPSQPHRALAEAEADTKVSGEGSWMTAAQIILGDRRTIGGTTVVKHCRMRGPAGKAPLFTGDSPRPAT